MSNLEPILGSVAPVQYDEDDDTTLLAHAYGLDVGALLASISNSDD